MPQITPYGWAESTAAMRGILGRVNGGGARGKRKRRSKGKVAKAARKTKRRASKRVKRAGGKKLAHMVKGSAAAKKHMAKLRKMAKKRRG